MADEYAGFRDAIHVPYIVVTCDIRLQPGCKVSLRHDNRCEIWTGDPDEPMWHGVADPFRESTIPAGEAFRCMIRKECFTQLRHDFEIDVNDYGGTATCHSVCNIR